MSANWSIASAVARTVAPMALLLTALGAAGHAQERRVICVVVDDLGCGASDQEKGAGGEIQLTDAMAKMIGKQPFHGFTFEGERHDCGSAAGFVIAQIALSLGREDVGPAVREYLAGL